MRRLLGLLAFAAATSGGTSPTVAADELVMPFACNVERGDVRLARANETSYRVIGGREELIFSDCAGGASGRCETLMVHKFAIECDGGRVAWSRVAAAASPLGISLPARLPQGFAPVSRLSARFVLPSLARTEGSPPRVARQDLSPDSVIESRDGTPTAQMAAWHTVVKADFLPQAPAGDVFRVASVVTTLIALLLAMSLLAAGRWRFPLAASNGLSARAREGAAHFAARAGAAAREAMMSLRATASYFDASSGPNEDQSALNGAFDMAQARIAETELAVASLPADLLLRDVLLSEIATIRARAADIFDKHRRQARQRSSAQLRALTRDLDRIARIAHGAGQQPRADERPEEDAPRTIFEACRVLGINADAPPAAVKKIVDALRMTWHPDHARDEADRVGREARMKQINAAWDLIRQMREAA